jgi:microsomal dipeptidase-like Zn-dependent dipeptidase
LAPSYPGFESSHKRSHLADLLLLKWRCRVPRAIAAICRFTLWLALPLWGQTFDFENGISGWQQTGDAFRGQPYCGAITSTIFAPSKLGGSYWKDLAYPLGQQGTCLITTIAQPSDKPVGSLTSPEFSLSTAAPFFSFRIGGTEDSAHEQLQLEIRLPETADAERLRQIREWLRARVGGESRDGAYWVAYAATGHNSEALRQEVVEIPEFLRNLPARIRMLDTSESGHVNVDYIQFTSAEPAELRVPVWGFADYHTHPMSYMAFGGMKGIRTLWGIPGGSIDDYSDPTAISRDIPICVRGHGGGYLAEPFINSSQLLHYDLPSIVKSILFPHGRRGGPEFNDFPSHLMGAHEQMHVTMIGRAYEGGLRLLVALATDNKAAQFLVGRVEHGHMVLIGEKESMEAQLRGMKRLAELNQNWMEVAYSAADARRIILHNKLAIVLGVEYDQLGELGFGTDEQEPQREADYLWGLGARTVIPIHAINNKLGGPPVFVAPYNWLNDLLHRESTDATSGMVRKTSPAYFEVTDDTSCAPHPKDQMGECVLNKLDSKLQLRVAIGRSIFNWLRMGPNLLFASRQGQFDTQYGNKNARGLTAFGARYIAAMMDRGLILDTAHMSDRSVADTFVEIGERLARQHPGCDGFAYGSRPRAECDADAYPAIISHAHFRGQAIYDPVDVPDYRPSEYDISDSNLAMVRRVGGVIGPFVAEPRIDKSNITGIGDDCGNSSKNFGFSFRYAAERINTASDDTALASRVGMATDMTFIPMVSPRYGKHACEGYNPTHPQPTAPVTLVSYSGPSALVPYRMGQRVFDFNQDGLAHYGLLPDLLQDLKDLRDDDTKLLFRSAEGYLQMWEKVERLRGRVRLSP